MAELGQTIRYEGMFDGSEGEPMSHFPFQLKDGVGNSTIRGALKDLKNDHNYLEFNSLQSFQKVLSCFEPLPETILHDPKHPQAETLWDQLGDAYYFFKHLNPEEQAIIHGVTDLAVWSLGNSSQDRRVQGKTVPLARDIQDLAIEMQDSMDAWLPKAPPKEHAAKVSDLFHLIPLSKKESVIGSLISGALILSACSNGRVVVSPDLATATNTPQAAITQEVVLPQIEPSAAIPAPSILSTNTETSPTAQTETEVSLPSISTEVVVGFAPIVPGSGEQQSNNISPQLENILRDAKFGFLAANNVVSVETSQNGTDICSTAIPITIYNPDALPDRGEVFIGVTNGVAQYEYTQVLAQVPIPHDTADATYSCVLGYARTGNETFQPGTLRTLLLVEHTDGSMELVASMQAGFTMEDDVSVQGDIVRVNGEVQDWDYEPGMALTNFEAGIPANPEDCNQMELQLRADGSIDEAWLANQLRALSTVEHQWLDDQGITVADVGVFNPVGDIMSSASLPYPFLRTGEGINNLIPTSCTRFIYNGREYFIYGIAGKRSADSTQIGIIHGAYDVYGNELDAAAVNHSDDFNRLYTQDLVYAAIRDNTFYQFDIYLGGYGQSDNQDVLNRWQLSQALTEANETVGVTLGGPSADLVEYTDSEYAISTNEETRLITQIEQTLYPIKNIVPNP